MKKILFVCTANTCRSPMAQVIFDTRTKDEGLFFRAESAATEALGYASTVTTKER